MSYTDRTVFSSKLRVFLGNMLARAAEWMDRPSEDNIFFQSTAKMFGLPDYKFRIPYPMDLSTIKAKCRNQYCSVEEFELDVMLMLDNAVAYWGKGSYVKYAHNLRRDAIPKIVSLNEKFRAEAAKPEHQEFVAPLRRMAEERIRKHPSNTDAALRDRRDSQLSPTPAASHLSHADSEDDDRRMGVEKARSVSPTLDGGAVGKVTLLPRTSVNTRSATPPAEVEAPPPPPPAREEQDEGEGMPPRKKGRTSTTPGSPTPTRGATPPPLLAPAAPAVAVAVPSATPTPPPPGVGGDRSGTFPIDTPPLRLGYGILTARLGEALMRDDAEMSSLAESPGDDAVAGSMGLGNHRWTVATVLDAFLSLLRQRGYLRRDEVSMYARVVGWLREMFEASLLDSLLYRVEYRVHERFAAVEGVCLDTQEWAELYPVKYLVRMLSHLPLLLPTESPHHAKPLLRVVQDLILFIDKNTATFESSSG